MIKPCLFSSSHLSHLRKKNIQNIFLEICKWDGHAISLYANTPVKRSINQHNYSTLRNGSNLILVVPRPSLLQQKRVELKQKLKGSISLIKEKTSFHPNIEMAIDDLKNTILDLREDAVTCIKSIEDDLRTDSNNESPNNLNPTQLNDQRCLSEIWRVSYNLGIELQNECIKFMTQDRAEQFALGLADFCIKWADYIVDKTEPGKGRTG